jgi:hypothetical protein
MTYESLAMRAPENKDLLTEREAREQELPMSPVWYRRKRLTVGDLLSFASEIESSIVGRTCGPGSPLRRNTDLCGFE